MVKINGENREHLTDLNVPHLRRKINKTCANRPVSCVNGEVRTEFGSLKEPAYRCMAALGRRACPLRHRLRDAASPFGRGGIAQAIASLSQRDSLSLCEEGKDADRELLCAFLLKKLPEDTFYWTFILLYSCQNKKTQEGRGMKDIELRYVGGHVEVYTEAGAFLFSADTLREAMEELDAA